jgi:hypothetical protein
VAGDAESGLLKHAKTPEDAAALKKFDPVHVCSRIFAGFYFSAIQPSFI